MAYNTNAPRGLVPVSKITGSAWSGQTVNYSIASGYATSIGLYDPITVLADGTIGIAVAGSAVRGILAGVQYIGLDGIPVNQRGWVASTTVKSGTTVIAYVIDDTDMVFDVQETNGSSAAGTPLALADINQNINFVIGTPDSLNFSTSSINNTSKNTTATLNLKIIGLSPYPGNAVGAFANWLCTWNNHDLKGGTGTAGV